MQNIYTKNATLKSHSIKTQNQANSTRLPESNFIGQKVKITLGTHRERKWYSKFISLIHIFIECFAKSHGCLFSIFTCDCRFASFCHFSKSRQNGILCWRNEIGTFVGAIRFLIAYKRESKANGSDLWNCIGIFTWFRFCGHFHIVGKMNILHDFL